jgi:hypothetical protein
MVSNIKENLGTGREVTEYNFPSSITFYSSAFVGCCISNSPGNHAFLWSTPLVDASSSLPPFCVLVSMFIPSWSINYTATTSWSFPSYPFSSLQPLNCSPFLCKLDLVTEQSLDMFNGCVQCLITFMLTIFLAVPVLIM